MADGDDEVGAGEDVQLAELDALVGLDVAGRAQHGEQHVAVALELGPLVCGDGVLDREVVDPELSRDRAHLPRVRAVQPIQPMPCWSRSSS